MGRYLPLGSVVGAMRRHPAVSRYPPVLRVIVGLIKQVKPPVPPGFMMNINFECITVAVNE